MECLLRLVYQKGSEVSGSGPVNDNNLITSEGTEKNNYLELPVQAKLYITKKKINVWLMVGPEIGCLINGKTKSTLAYHDIERGTVEYSPIVIERKWSNIKDLGLRRLELSLTTGIGGDFKIGKGKLFLNVNYIAGITNLVNDDKESYKNTKQYNRGLVTSLGYMIPISK